MKREEFLGRKEKKDISAHEPHNFSFYLKIHTYEPTHTHTHIGTPKTCEKHGIFVPSFDKS